MILESISLTNFKNYEQAEISFCNEINYITGLNGSGKTNLLDAIHYLSMTRSAINSIDGQNIKNKEEFFVIQGNFIIKDKKQKVICSLKSGAKKKFRVNDTTYLKLSEHIGEFPLVLIAPNDYELIRNGSETRRKFFDSTISQTSKEYLRNLIEYTHYLKQRNALLKRFRETGKRDMNLIGQYDYKLIKLGSKIFDKRKDFIEKYVSDFSKYYNFLSNDKENISINYTSKASDSDFENLFKNSIEKDILLERTNVGIHRDDYEFLINAKAVKKIGSQGQQKSFLVSLKLAQLDFLKTHFGFAPLLLLDDIFDKLDDERISKLIELISIEKFQQIFITDAREERIKTLPDKIKGTLKMIKIIEGKIKYIITSKK